jgi:hypothetical protein
LSEKITVRVYAPSFTLRKGSEAWSVFAIIHDEVIEIYVFVEVVESALSIARASAACFDARAA